MKKKHKGLILALLGLCVYAQAEPVSQNYDDHVVNKKGDWDDNIVIPKGVKLAPSRQVDMAKSPFKRQVMHYERENKRLQVAVKKMRARFEKHSSTKRETIRHETARDKVKAAKKQIVKRYDVLCAPTLPKLDKISQKIRGAQKKLEHANANDQKLIQAEIDNLMREFETTIQPLIDDVFVYYNFPNDGTGDNKMYPSRNRSFYNNLNKQIQTAIKKGGFVVSDGQTDEVEDEEEEATDAYTKQFTETTKEFLEEHFEAGKSERFNPAENPFKAIHNLKVNRLAKLAKTRDRMADDLTRRSGKYRQTSYHLAMSELTRDIGRETCKRFHRLLRKDATQFNRHADQVRRWLKVMIQKEGTPEGAHAEQQYKRHCAAGSKILQRMVDKVFAHEPWPSSESEYSIPSKYRSLYEKASKMFYEGTS